VEGSERTEDDQTQDMDDESISVEDVGGDAVRSLTDSAEGASDGGSNVGWMNNVKACGCDCSLG